MFRLLALSATALSVLVAAAPALAADSFAYPPELRGAFPDDFDMSDEGDPIGFELGVRYWYSWGSQRLSVGGDAYGADDNTHSGELALRINDYSTGTYLKGLAGYSAIITGSYSNPLNPAGNIVDGRVMYAGADLGYLMLGDGKSGIGALVGYQYWNDSPDVGRSNFTTATSASDIAYNQDTGVWSLGFDSEPNNIDVHALRLGLTAKADFGVFDITAEGAVVPYAWVNGTLGADGGLTGATSFPGCDVPPPGGCAPVNLKASETSIDGWGYGAMGEIMFGIHPMENLTLRVGGRAWYLQGTYDATYRGVSVTAPQRQPDVEDPDNPGVFLPPDPLYSAPALAQQDWIVTDNPFSLFRYGILAEVTYSF